ncbi:MAG: lysophospholipid acyltransferase family protein [Lentisphaeria bacterium]|nr:lysophospholipid acyltransferase family protein [Lentisphaeria bacterium]
MISASRDGQYIADLVAQFGIKSVRGSSSRNAVKVLHEAFKSLKGGCLIGMTPDGPRGPKYHLNKGAIQLASKMGIPIVPMAVNYSSYWELKSWDRFQIPKPWAKITLVVGSEIVIPPDLSKEEFESYRQKVEDALNAISVDKK